MAAATDHQTATVDLWLRLELDSDPISGSVRSAEGTVHPFVGWLALSAVLEKARRGTLSTVTRDGRVDVDPDGQLSPTERGVVELTCEGLTNPQIAAHLGISPRTVQGHLLKVFRKLGIASRTQLVAVVMRAQIDAGRVPNGCESK